MDLKPSRRVMAWMAALLLPVLSACSAAAPAIPKTSNPFAGALWDDGKAEYSIYAGVTQRYGQPRATEARMIVVKEDLLRSTLVKSDSGPIAGKTVTAIKLNFNAEFKTGTYDYRQSSTVMFDRADLHPLKEVMAHHELCGITFVRIAPENGQLMHHSSSYWEGEAERTVRVDWPAGTALWWDALPVSLRQWAGEASPFEMPVWLLPSQVTGRSPLASTRPVRALLRRVDSGPLTVAAGTFRAIKFAITTPLGADAFWFDARPPHVLLRVDTRDGRSLALKQTLRLDYWNRHMNGDEKVLE